MLELKIGDGLGAISDLQAVYVEDGQFWILAVEDFNKGLYELAIEDDNMVKWFMNGTDMAEGLNPFVPCVERIYVKVDGEQQFSGNLKVSDVHLNWAELLAHGMCQKFLANNGGYFMLSTSDITPTVSVDAVLNSDNIKCVEMPSVYHGKGRVLSQFLKYLWRVGSSRYGAWNNCESTSLFQQNLTHTEWLLDMVLEQNITVYQTVYVYHLHR